MRFFELKDFEIGPYTVDVVCCASTDIVYPMHRLIDVSWSRVVDTATGKPVDVEEATPNIWDELEAYIDSNWNCLEHWDSEDVE